MTQPGVSQHIKKLEQQVGRGLITRIGKRFELTEAGLAIYHYACLMQRQQQALLANLAIDMPFSGECRIGCSGSMASLLYPDLIKKQQNHPDLHMYLEAGPNKRIIESILANQLDLGIVTQHLVQPELVSTEIGAQSLCLVLPKVVAGKAYLPNINFESLTLLGMIEHPDANYYWQQLKAAFFQAEPTSAIKTTGYVNQLNQILLPVANGLGFTVLPEFAVRSFVQQQDIQIAKNEDGQLLTLFEPLYLVHKQHRVLAKRYQHIIQLIKSLV